MKSEGGLALDKKYLPEDFPYPLNEDMAAAYAAKEKFDFDPENSNLYWSLKDAVYQVKLTLKSLKTTGWVEPSLAEEIEEYFWSFLL